VAQNPRTMERTGNNAYCMSREISVAPLLQVAGDY
jgi:hypothetical protein